MKKTKGYIMLGLMGKPFPFKMSKNALLTLVSREMQGPINEAYQVTQW